MHIAGFGSTQIPFHMFELARQADDARRFAKLANIYYRGQQQAWDGRQVLANLVDKHGGIDMPIDKRNALGNIFAMIMWGELAAWKVSAQLADRLVPLEAKMAATAQVHDEARHFYVMYDYLKLLGYTLPRKLNRPSRAVLDLVLNTDSLMEKVIGMQLMVETLALTIFQLVREAKAEPVLSDLLRYIERDEARHVGLGVQHLPQLMREASRWQHAKAVVLQLKIAGWTLRGLKLLEKDFADLGISTRRVIQVGRNKIFTSTEMLWDGMSIDKPRSKLVVDAALDSLTDFLFPRPEVRGSLRQRLASARATWRAGGLEVQRVDLAG